MVKPSHLLLAALSISGFTAGCSSQHTPLARKAIKPRAKVVGVINFEFDSSKVTLDQRYKLKKILSKVDNNPIILEGHADSKGSPEYNKKLSKERVSNVKKAILELEQDIEIKEKKSFGENRIFTKVKAATNDKNRLNRRVVIKKIFPKSNITARLNHVPITTEEDLRQE